MRKLTTLLMFFLFSVVQVWAQNRTVTGKVTDEKGAAVAGATVKVNGTNKGITKEDGSFSISVPANSKNISITAIGLATQTFVIPTSGVVTAKMLAASTAPDLDEVIVQVPYGTKTAKTFTGSASVVGAKDIAKQQNTSVLNSLDGLVSGITTTNGGGQPGANSASIRVRGFGSISASNAPLYVVNGVPYDGDISAISADDVENVTVLKDASAASLYGSRAANGVVMITTKKGKKGKYNVNLTLRNGFLTRGIPEYDRINSKQYYELMWEASKNSYFFATGLAENDARDSATNNLVDNLVYNQYNVENNKLIDPKTGKLNPNAKSLWNDSWNEALFRKATRKNVNLSISGASDKSDFYLSLGYLNEDGTVVNSGYKRYNIRLNNNVKPLSWLSAGVNLDATYSNTAFSKSNGSATGSNAFYFTRNIAPIYPVYQHNLKTGEIIIDPETGSAALDWGVPETTPGGTPGQTRSRPFLTNSHPLGTQLLDDVSTTTYNATANTFLEFKFTKELSLKTSFGANIYEDRSKNYQNNKYGDAANVKGRTTIASDRQISYTLNQVFSWDKEFGNHAVKLLAGHENYYLKYAQQSASGINNRYNDLNELDNDSAISSQPSSSEDNHRIESYFGGLNYDYKSKYLFSASVRRDGSSRFAPENRWGTFYSVGAGWRLSEEVFLKNVKWINELKLKASYGEQGNENLGNGLDYYLYQPWYVANGEGGYNAITRRVNRDVKWEGNNVTNIGVEFTLFKRKLQGSLEYFTRTTKDMLFEVPLPATSGYLSQYKNVGTLRNYGIELSLGYNAVQKKNFDWRIDLNLTSFKNEVLSMPVEFNKTGGIVSGTKKISVGRSIYEFWLREFAGVDAATGKALYFRDVLDSKKVPTGERILTDNPSDASFYYFGTSIPKFSGGLTNSFRFKNIELSVLLTFSYGGKFYDGNYSGLMHSGSYGTAWHTDILNRWQKPGDLTNVPRVQANSSLDASSTRFLFDGSYINIKNISLTYNLPKQTLQKLKLANIAIFTTIDNVALFTAKKGADPQSGFSGVSGQTFVPFRSFTFGLNLNF